MQQIFFYTLFLQLCYNLRYNGFDSLPQKDNELYQFHTLPPSDLLFDNQDIFKEDITANNIQTTSSIYDQINLIEQSTSVTIRIADTDQLSKEYMEGDDSYRYDQRNIRNLQIREAVQYQFDHLYPNSIIEIKSQFKFQFEQFGEGSPHEIQNVKRIEGNNVTDQERTLPDWLHFDEGSRIFRGQVAEEDENISYEIQIKFSSGANQIIDKFIFLIYKNQGICALQQVSIVDVSSFAMAVSILELRENIYALVADRLAGLTIFEVNDPKNPIQVSQIFTNGSVTDVSIVKIESKIYALMTADKFVLKIIEVTDPYNPVETGSYGADVKADSVRIMEKNAKIYALVAAISTVQGLKIIDITDPYKPVLTSSITKGTATSISIMQKEANIYVLMADVSRGMKIIEITDPLNPVLVGNHTTSNALGVCSMVLREKIYALIADGSAGLKIIEVTNPQDSSLVGNIDTDGFARKVITKQIGAKIYALVADDKKGLKFFEITDLQNPILVGSIETDGSAYGVSIMEKDAKIYAIVADYANGLVIIEIKLSYKYRNYFSPISYSQYDTPNHAIRVETIKQGNKIYAFVADNNNGLLIFELTDPQYPVLVKTVDTDGSVAGITTMVLNEKMYAFVGDWNAGLKIFEVTDLYNPVLLSSIDTNGGAGDATIMKIRGKMYAFLADGSAGLKIFEVTDPYIPVLMGSIDTDGGAKDVTMMEKDAKIYVLVADTSTGLKIFDITDLQNPVLVGTIDTDGLVLSVSIMEKEAKIFAVVADGSKGMKIIEITDPQNPVLVSSKDISGNAYGITTLEIRGKLVALIADYEFGIQIVDFTDLQNPEIVGTKELKSQSSYKMESVNKIEINQKIYALLLAGGSGLQIMKITDNIAMYPYIKSNIIQEIREFIINLYPIYMKSLLAFMGENVLLSLSLIYPKQKKLTPIPYWVSVDYETKVIYFIPVSKESLEILRYIFYTFSTKVNTSELNNTSPDKTSDMVVSELVKNGYLDTNLQLTKSFNIDKDLLLDPSFNKTVIRNILAQYYHEGYFELMIEDFLELNKAPTIDQGKLQREFDRKVEKPKVTQKIDFQFSDTTFIDPDGDRITYTITNIQIDISGNITNGTELPPWLTFDRSTRRFQGIPSIQDMGVYTINVSASDKYEEATQNFTIFLTNNAPTVQEEIPEEFKSLKLGSKYEYIFSESLFNDSDDDHLNYQAEINYTTKVNNTQIKQLLLPTGDFWIKFDSNARRFTGKPGSTDIGENLEGFDQIFTIKITATDIAEKSVSTEYNLRVTKLYLILNKDQNIQDQLEKAKQQKSIALKVGGKLEFAFSDQTFISEDQDQLTYRLQLREASLNSTQFGNWIDISQVSDYWLSFDGQNRRIYGIPLKKNLKKYELNVSASDGYKEKEQLFAFSLTNKGPIVQSSIKNQIKELLINEIFEFQFDFGTFFDDGDPLTYIALLTNGEDLPKWLTFKPAERKFEGTPTKFEDIKVSVIATDLAEETVYDDFNIKVIPSTAYIIGQLIYYGSILFSMLGLLKNKILIYELFCKIKYRYQRVEEAYVGEEYAKKIYLIKEDIENVQKLWKKLEENTISEFKFSKDNWFQKGYINGQEVDQDKLYKALYQTFPGAKIMLENMSDKQGIMDGMVANILIINDPNTYKVYKRFKNSSSYFEKDNKCIFSPKDWYRKYICIKQNELEELQTIDINYEELEKQLQSMKIVVSYDKILLGKKILADSRGLDEFSSYESSKGDNIHINQLEIVQIKVKKEIIDNLGNGFVAAKLRAVMHFAKLNYSQIPIIDNGEILRWLDVKIEQNTLSFFGIPRKEDKGQYMIQIMGAGNFLFREFFLRVNEQRQIDIELVQMDTYNPLENKKEEENKLAQIDGKQKQDDIYMEKAINLNLLKKKKLKLKKMQL